MSDHTGRMPAVTVEMLAENRLFHGVSGEMLTLIHQEIKSEVAQTGDWILREGDVSDFMFLVLNGELEVVSHGGSPNADVRVALLGPGDWVGEMSLLEVLPRSASVRALAPSMLLRVSAADLKRLVTDRNVAQYAQLMANIARELGRRLRVADRLIARSSAAIVRQYVLESRRPPAEKDKA
jgi:CRP/FNR family cyclic AMP-dependent transcriptional regulator